MRYYGKIQYDEDLVTKKWVEDNAGSSGTINVIQVEGTPQEIINKTVNITREALGLSQALKFIGISSTPVTDQGTEEPTISGYSGKAKTIGNVLIYNNNEFLWANNVWNKLGDNSSWQSKINATGLLKGNGGGNVSAATAGTDYQAPLISGTNIKTINNQSILGNGNITIRESMLVLATATI